MYCGECKKECTAHGVDNGIGPLEAWGRKFVDTDYQLESDCCDGEVFEDEDCQTLADYGDWSEDQQSQRDDYEYENMRDRA